VSFGGTHQLDEDFALASALATKAAHDLLQALAQLLRLLTQGLGRWRALACDRLDEAQDFF
jgi:mannitol/fructose-specific phosphotransferase system IIA component (Ntr-type)